MVDRVGHNQNLVADIGVAKNTLDDHRSKLLSLFEASPFKSPCPLFELSSVARKEQERVRTAKVVMIRDFSVISVPELTLRAVSASVARSLVMTRTRAGFRCEP